MDTCIFICSWFNFWSQTCLSPCPLAPLKRRLELWSSAASVVLCAALPHHWLGRRQSCCQQGVQNWPFQLQKRAVYSPSVKTGIYLTQHMQDLGNPCYYYLKNYYVNEQFTMSGDQYLQQSVCCNSSMSKDLTTYIVQ